MTCGLSIVSGNAGLFLCRGHANVGMFVCTHVWVHFSFCFTLRILHRLLAYGNQLHAAANVDINDFDGNFCQGCGTPYKTHGLPPSQQQSYDFKAIDQRLACFRSTFGLKPYERQKLSLEHHLAAFLAYGTPPRTLASCTGEDVVRFLIGMDAGGKTRPPTVFSTGRLCVPHSVSSGYRMKCGWKITGYFHRERPCRSRESGFTSASEPISQVHA